MKYPEIVIITNISNHEKTQASTVLSFDQVPANDTSANIYTGKIVHEDVMSAVYAGTNAYGETMYFRVWPEMDKVEVIACPKEGRDLEAELMAATD